MRGKVLVVEDDETNRKFFVTVLLEKGYEVVEAADGEEALAVAARESPSLILMDIVLPKMTGYEVLKACRSKGLLGGSKVYALTASSVADVKEAGFDGVIVKPVRVRAFLKTIEEIFETRNREQGARGD